LAFYGRISTGEYQDPASSRAWQLDSARQTIAGRGRIVVEYFDVGCSRRLPWTERPEAAALLSAITSANCPFDAVVVGEYERAFHGAQLTHVAGALASHGVQLWLPETNGPVDLDDPDPPGADDAAGSPVQPGNPARPIPHHHGHDRSGP
jgi:site-specific DNA recombinase